MFGPGSIFGRKLTDNEKKEQEEWEHNEEVRKKTEDELMQNHVDSMYKGYDGYD